MIEMEKIFGTNEFYKLNYFDPITDFPNRFLLIDRLDKAITRERKSKLLMAVLLIDIDRFKNINDTLGYEAGDHVLIEVSARLRNLLGDSGMAARFGADEFVVVIEGMSDISDVELLSNKILEAFHEPFRVDKRKFYVTVSIGSAVCVGDCVICSGSCANGCELLRRADVAKSRAKEAGRNRNSFSAQEVISLKPDKMELEAELHLAMERGEFLLYYQPKVNLSTGRICGVEALIRWQHPVRGIVSPKDFIPLLEESGLIVPVSEWIISTACAQAALWINFGLGDVCIAINISTRQFQDDGLVDLLKKNILRNGLSYGAIEVEITESILMQNPEKATRILREIRELGIAVSIDDFGTGYSSLAYLKQFPVNTLKIDRAFVLGLPGDSRDAAICKAVLKMAAALGVTVVAEGVETAEQLEFMRVNNCHELQGFLFSKPLPSDEVECLLAEGKRMAV
jgi:diguanylate cyclase (GGDEF)-like protein